MNLFSTLLVLFLISTDNSNQFYNQISSATVCVDGKNNFGTGVILAKEQLDETNFGYYVITAKHVISDRFQKKITKTDGIRGRMKFQIIQSTIKVITKSKNEYNSQILWECESDRAILYFVSSENLDFVELIPDNLIDKIFPGQDAYAFGYQITRDLFILTKGIVSLVEDNHIISDVKISPGSSGGGLFIIENNKLYLIGIANEIATFNKTIIPHIGKFIKVNDIVNTLNKLKEEKCTCEQD